MFVLSMLSMVILSITWSLLFIRKDWFEMLLMVNLYLETWDRYLPKEFFFSFIQVINHTVAQTSWYSSRLRTTGKPHIEAKCQQIKFKLMLIVLIMKHKLVVRMLWTKNIPRLQSMDIQLMLLNLKLTIKVFCLRCWSKEVDNSTESLHYSDIPRN